MPKPGDERKQKAEAVEQMRRSLAAFEQAAHEIERNGKTPEEYEDPEDDLPVARFRRHDTPPPASPPKDKFNPDGIVDIITFCEHPYFLNLRLTPWQRLIVKCFYAGTHGNTHLRINEDVSEDCSACVWNYNRKFEERFYKARLRGLEDGKGDLMPIENSPCLVCTRFDPEVRKERYEAKFDDIYNQDEIEEVENLKLRELADQFQNEMDLLNDPEILPEVRNQIIKKFGKKFMELILVLGRRSGKSFMVSVIALYEVYRFLSMGHPQARFPIMEFDTITILNVAVSEGQAKGAIYEKIRQLAEASPYFTQHIGKATQLEMFFLTEHDKQENKRRLTVGQEPLIGTIQLKSGHSNAAGLVGGTMAVIIIDEMAEMAKASEGGTDDELYDKLKPAISTFGREGKVICISNPLGPFGKFHKLYEDSFDDNQTLMFQLATWLSNPYIEQSYLDAQKRKDPTNYQIFYGARFGAAGADAWIADGLVKRAFDGVMGTRRAESGQPAVRYYAHLDPAKSSDYYTLVVCHAEPIPGLKGPDDGPVMRVIVDHMHLWRPKGKNQPINSEEVDAYILRLATRFRLVQVSYDTWNSQGSITKLKAHSINAVERTFDLSYKSAIYGELYELFSEGRISFYNQDTVWINPVTGNAEELREVHEAKDQFINLQRRWNGRVYKIEALTGKHDDFPDAVAAAAFECLSDKIFKRLPKTTSFRLGRFR